MKKEIVSFEGVHCANCSAPMQGEFCHECGQSIHTVLRPMHHMVEDTLDMVLHVDGRVIHTLPPLLLRPGFLAFVLVFAAAASAQLAFGVVAPFFYQTGLGYSAAIYGLVALGLGGVNLAGELGCAHFARFMPARVMGFGAFALFLAGSVVLTATGMIFGLGFASITIGGALVLGGCGVLCPMMYGMALGLFERDHGLIGGLISALCYLAVSGAMAIAAVLPEATQAPTGWLYLGLCAIAGALLAISLPAARQVTQIQEGTS